MKELLIKIKALFDGSGADQAAASLRKVGDSGQSATGIFGKLKEAMSTSEGRTGALAGAFAALGTAGMGLVTGALTSLGSMLASTARAMAQGVAEAANYAAAMSKVANQTGQTAGDAAILDRAFKNAGFSSGQAVSAMNLLTQALTGINKQGQPTAETFSRLGLSISSLQGMSGPQQLDAIAQAIARIKDPAEQSRVAVEIFGEAGKQLMGILGDPTAFQTATQQLGLLAENLNVGAEDMARFSQALGSMDTKQLQFFVGLSSRISGDLGAAADQINRLDFSRPGQEVGYVVRGIVEITQNLSSAATALQELTGLVAPLQAAFEQATRAIPGLDLFLPIKDSLGWLRDYGKESYDAAQREGANAVASQAESGKQIYDRLREGSLGAIMEAGGQASAGVAETGRVATEQVRMTSEQIRQATEQITAAMAQANSEGVTPAMNALTTSVQEAFARITGELTSAVANIQASQAQQEPAFTTAMQGLITTLQQSNQAILTAIQGGQQQLSQQFTSASNQIITANSQGAIELGASLQQLVLAVQQSTQSVVTGIQTGQQQVAQQFIDGANQIITANSQGATAILPAIQAMVQAVAQNNAQIVTTIQTGNAQIAEQIAGLQQGLQASFQAVQQNSAAMSQAVQAMVQATGEGSRQTVQAVQSGVREVAQAMQSGVSGVASAIGSLAARVSAALANLQQQIINVAARIR